MIGQLWRVADGDVRVAVDEPEWWGASLSVLIAAVHHANALATRHPENDPVEVARDVLADVDELYAAAAVADAQARRAEPGDRPASVSVRRDGAESLFAPGAEVANLAWCLELFALAVVDPGGADAAAARGATAYAASAWSVDIGRASGTLSAVDPPRQRGTTPSRRLPTSAMIAGRRPITESAGERAAPLDRRSRGPGSGLGAASCDRVALARRRRRVLWGGGMAGTAGGRCALGGGVRVRAVVPELGQAPAIPPRRARRHHRPRLAAAPEAEAAMIRQAWAERTRPRRRERVAGVHPAG